MKAYLTPPGKSRPTLIVMTCADANESAQSALRDELYGRGCRNGLLIDQSRFLVFRDTFALTGAKAIEVAMELKTGDVLALVRGKTLDARVRAWIELLATSWQHAISPNHPATSHLLQDVMPAAVGSDIYYLPEAS